MVVLFRHQPEIVDLPNASPSDISGNGGVENLFKTLILVPLNGN